MMIHYKDMIIGPNGNIRINERDTGLHIYQGSGRTSVYRPFDSATNTLYQEIKMPREDYKIFEGEMDVFRADIRIAFANVLKHAALSCASMKEAPLTGMQQHVLDFCYPTESMSDLMQKHQISLINPSFSHFTTEYPWLAHHHENGHDLFCWGDTPDQAVKRVACVLEHGGQVNELVSTQALSAEITRIGFNPDAIVRIINSGGIDGVDVSLSPEQVAGQFIYEQAINHPDWPDVRCFDVYVDAIAQRGAEFNFDMAREYAEQFHDLHERVKYADIKVSYDDSSDLSM